MRVNKLIATRGESASYHQIFPCSAVKIVCRPFGRNETIKSSFRGSLSITFLSIPFEAAVGFWRNCRTKSNLKQQLLLQLILRSNFLFWKKKANDANELSETQGLENLTLSPRLYVKPLIKLIAYKPLHIFFFRRLLTLRMVTSLVQIKKEKSVSRDPPL